MREATARGTPLRIVGGDTKRFLGREAPGAVLNTSGHTGIVSYDPAELVITARAGTPLAEVEAALAAQRQRLPFEPPSFGDSATVGGTVACGLAGPARAAFGPLRNHVLGVRVLTGDGRVLRFGGEVMKNVAGYDVARTMAGASARSASCSTSRSRYCPARWHREPCRWTSTPRGARGARRLPATAMPLTASCWSAGSLLLRFEGTERTLDDVQRRVGGMPLDDGTALWRSVREHTHPSLPRRVPLWRLHVPAAASVLPLTGSR